ncbi:MAG: hypothetical protein K0Q74_1283, partial [Gammaproteobacteria bacterium]|nr:hypothetical protein [Gammaproteobacteria bacterium]
MLSSYLEIVWKEWANFNVQRLLLGFWLPTTNEHLLLNYFKKPPPYALKRLLLGYDYLSLSEQLESITLFIISWLFLPAAFLLHLFQYIPIVKHFTQVLQIFLVILCRSIVRLIKECLIMLFWEEKPRLLLLGLSLAVVFAPFYLPYFGVTGLVVGTSYYIFTGLISLGMGLLCLFTNKIKLALAKVPDFPARLLVWLEGDAAEFQVRLIGEVGQHYYQRMSDSKDQAAELHWAYNKGGLLVLQRHKEVYLSERSEFNDGHLLLVPGDKEGVTIRHPNKNNQTTVNVRCEKDNYFLKFSGDKHWISCGPQDVWDQLERRDFRDVVKSIAHCPRVRRDQGHYYVDHPTSEVKGPFKTLREANQHLKALDEDTRRLALLSPDIYLATFLNPGDRLPLIGGGELCFDSSNTPPRVIKKVEAAVHNYDFSSPRRTSLEVGHSRAIEDEEKLDASVDYSTSNRSSLSEKDLQVRTKTSGRVYSPFSGSLLAVQKIVKRLKKKQPHLEEYLEGIEQMVMWVEQYPRRQGFIADLKSELFELLNKEIPQEILQISQKSREIRLDIHQDIQEGRFEKALESIEKYQDEMAWLVKAQAAICLRPFFMKEHFQALRAYIISDQGVFETHRVIHDELLQMAKQIEDSVVRDNIMAHIEQGQFDRAIKSIVAYEGRVMSGRLKALLEAALVAKGNLAAMPLLNDTTSAIILRLIDKQAYMSARLVLAISSSSVFRESEHERVLVELASIVDASDDETIYNAIEDLCNQEKAYVLIAEIIDYMEQGKSLKEIQDHTFIHRYHSLLNRLPEDHPKRCTLQIMMAKWKAQCLSESLLPVSLQEAKGAINEFKERPNWRERLEEVERMIFWIMLDPQLSMESLKKELSKLLNEEIPDAVVQQNESYKKIKSDIRRCIDRGRFAEAIRSIVTLVSPQVADMVHACERLKQQISKLAPYCLAHTFKRQLVQLDSIIGHCQFPHSNNLEMAHVLFKEWETFTEASLRILVCELKKLWVALPYEPNIEN